MMPKQIDPKKFKRMLTLAVALPLVLMVALAAVLIWQILRLISFANWVEKSNQTIAQEYEAEKLLIDMETGLRGFLLTGRGEFLEPYTRASAAVAPAFDELSGQFSGDADETENLDEIRGAFADWERYSRDVIALKQRGENFDARVSSGEGKRLVDSMRLRFDNLIRDEEMQRSQRTQAATDAARTAVISSIALTLLLGIVLTLFIARQFKKVAENYAQSLAEEENQRKLLSVTLGSIGDAVISTDVKGRVMFINGVAEKLTGWTRDEAVGQSIESVFRIIDEQTREAVELPSAKVLRDEGASTVFDDHTVLINKTGAEIPIDDSSSPIEDERGKLVGAILVFRDISQRRRDEKEREQLLHNNQMLLESAGEGIYGIDEKGGCTFINKAAARMLGYSQEEAVGKNMHDLSHYKHADGSPYAKNDCPIYKTFLDGKSCRVDNEVLWRRDGTPFPAEYSSFPLRENGETVGAVVTFSDVTARKQSEALVKQSEERFRSLIEATAQIVWTTLPTGEFVKDQIEWSRFTGQTFEQLKGWGWLNAVNPEDRVQTRESWTRALENRSLFEIKHRLRRHDGVYRFMAVRAVPILEADGTIREWVGVDTDITTQKEYEASLEEAKEAAEVANRTKSQFLANMSHELRTPLNAVILYSELLEEEAEDAGVEGFIPELQKIRNAGKQLLALVNDVLDLSKIEAGKMELYLENFDIAQMVKEVAATIKPLVEKKNNTLEIRCPDDIGEMRGDLTKTRQNLFNLLSNASKFTENGTIVLEVGRQTEDKREFVIFRVTDSGIGMTGEQMEKLFQPFSQADSSTTRKFGGTGLGLTITRHFCEMMGGEVSVKSDFGKGSTFTIKLPAQVAELPQVETEEESKAEDEKSVKAIDATDVLIVDDDPAVREVLSRFLGKEGFRVAVAPNGKEALRLARELRPKVITLDVMMPQMDGWSVLMELKADAELAQTPVIMLTMADDKNIGYSLGASDFLTKPLDRGRLVGLLNKYCAHQTGCPVMIVEDDAPTRQALTGMLEKQGWQVVQASNGREALEMLAEQKPSVILLDLMMPEMDGFEFTAEMRKRGEWRDIPIVVVTAKDITMEDRLRLSGSVEKILQKGAYSRDELLREVREIVGACATEVSR